HHGGFGDFVIAAPHREEACRERQHETGQESAHYEFSEVADKLSQRTRVRQLVREKETSHGQVEAPRHAATPAPAACPRPSTSDTHRAPRSLADAQVGSISGVSDGN